MGNDAVKLCAKLATGTRYMSNDTGEVLIEDGPDNKRLRIALREFKGTPLLDLRYWYVDKKSKELKPTSKGVSLTRANYLSMRSIAVDHHDAVMDFLDVGAISASHNGDGKLIAKQVAQNQQSVKTMSIEVAILKPSTKLYEVEYKGAVANIVFNKSHHFVKALSTDENVKKSQLDSTGKLVLAMDLSLMNIRGEGVTSPNILADQFEYDLTKYAQRLSRVGK